jgi:hypothetical protein
VHVIIAGVGGFAVLGGLARRSELLGKVRALEESGERGGAVAGLLVVRREVAKPAQLADPVGRRGLEVGRPCCVHGCRLTGQVGLHQHAGGQQRVPEPDPVNFKDDHSCVDGFAD